MVDRISRVERKTKETDVQVTVHLDRAGEVTANTGIGFFDHMLNAFGKHAYLDLTVNARGDTHVDDHHTVEDVGIILGQGISKALGEKRSIQRFGTAAVPLDEALTRVSLDISGRGGFYLHGEFPREKTGTFDTYLAEDFFRALTLNAGLTVHMELAYGRNAHHIVESAFKSYAVAFRKAAAVSASFPGIPSTKGIL